jgi:hypothetical protein
VTSLLFLVSLAFAAERTGLEVQLDDLRQEATNAFAQVATDRAALKKKPDEKAQAELWDRRSYWTHYMDLVLELRKAAAKMDLAPALPTRLAAAQRALKNTGVRVVTTNDGHVMLNPEPSSYADRETALKSAAAAAVYSRLQPGH